MTVKIKPGINLQANKETLILAGMAIGVAGFIFWQAKKGVEKVVDTVASVAKPVANAVNPASQTNAVQTVLNAGYNIVNPKSVTDGTTISTVLNDGLDTLRGWLGGPAPYDPNK